MTVAPVSSTKSSADTAAAPIVSAPQTLGTDDFMKLLAVQFEQQDPMKPMDDTAFIAQMAQFTSLSQTQTMTALMTTLNTNQGLATANSYLNQQVTVDNGDGTTSSGVVTGVQMDSSGPSLLVGGYAYPISSVLSVQAASVSNATPATPVTTTPPATTGGS